MTAGPRGRTTAAERLGAGLIGFGVVQFVVAMAWVQSAYPGYSLLQNYISDLGNTVTSPLHSVFNVSIMLLGVVAFPGILLTWSAFPAGGSRVIGLPLVLVASVAAILVGVFPENVNPPVHDFVSLMVFLPGGLAMTVLSFGMRPTSGWSPLRWTSLGLGAITLLALLYYAPTQTNNSTWDPGLLERLIVFPLLTWGVLVSIHILRTPSAAHPVPP
jgi:hypothetical membrane protein